ncbi:hypothetical protein D3C76_755300 [compost metagenome]
MSRERLVVVGFVGQVLHVQLQVDVFAQLVGCHRVVTNVGVDHGGVGYAAEHVIDIERTATDGQLRRDLIGRPQAGAVFRGVRQFVAIVGRTQRTTVNLLAVHVGVTGEDLPFVGELAGGRQLDTLHAGLAGVFVRGGIDLHTGVVFLGAEDIRGQGQTIVQQIPLGTDFVVLGGFRLHVAFQQVAVAIRRATQRVALRTFTQGVARWRGRRRVGRIDAAVFGGFVHHTELTGNEFAGVIALGRGHAGTVEGLVVGVEMVVAQAHVHQPLLGQRQGVEHVKRVGFTRGVGAGVVAADRTVPWIVRVRVRQRGAVVATWCADDCRVASGGGCGCPRRGVGVDGVRGLLAFLAAQLDTGGEAVLEAGDVDITKQVGLVGRRIGVADTGVGPTPDGAVVDVALAVVRLGQDVVLHAAAVAQGVLDGQRVVQVVLDGDGRRVGTTLAEVTIGQAVEVAAVATGVRLVRIGLGAGSRATGRDGVGNTRVRRVVAFQVVVVEVDASVGAQAEGERWRDTPAIVIDAFAAGDITFVAHQVQTTGSGVGELVVAVHGVALGLVRTPGKTTVERVAQVRFLAHQVDAAAGCAATANGRVRALAHFDRFNGEDFAALRTGIAHAVQVGVALGIEATDERTVALWVAAFASTEGDAWNGAQCVLHVQGAGVLEDLLRDDGDRARSVYQRRGVLGRGGFLDVVGGLVLGFAGDRGSAQRNGVARRFLVGFFSGESHVARRAGRDCHANGASEQTR